jgi:uncharacterized membrane protein SpoIIM required for sporulation
MALGPAIRGAVAVLRGRPGDLLPAYLLTPAVSGVVRVVGVVGLAVAALYLEATGRLDRFRANLSGRELTPPDPNADPEAFAAWVDAVAPVVDPLVTTTTVGVVAVTALLSAAAILVLSAVATAAQFAACRATLQDARGTTAAVSGARRHWPSMLGLLVGELLVWALGTGVAVALVAGATLVSTPVGALVGVVVGLLWLAAVLAVRLVFAFAPAAVVVDGVGVAAALSGSGRFVRSAPVDAVGYALLAAAALAVLGSAAALSAEAGGDIAGVGGFLLVSPALDLAKTALYVRRGGLTPPPAPERSVADQLLGGLGRGWSELTTFVRERPGLHALSAALFVVGFTVGWTLAAPLDGAVTASVETRLAGHFPPTAALLFGANNWSVAVATAFSGLALGVPAAVSMAFNGAAFGALGRLEADPLVLLAFVLPHGVVEIPAVVVAGAAGLWLGGAAWRSLRGRAPRALADAAERAFWVLVGVGVLLTIAGLIEAFVSPYYYRPFLG